MEEQLSEIKQLIDAVPTAVAIELQRYLSNYLDKCGLYYRIFSRCKTGFSASAKIELKNYQTTGKKMQDLIGVRVALYFQDDIDICVSIIEQNFHVCDKVRDTVGDDQFRPVRLNLVCNMPENIVNMLDSRIWDYCIDQTFEIQVRTIFSEGWHEIDHDLRYKNKQGWEDYVDLSRSFNGILAVLETCDWGILKIVDELSYQKYKEHDWEAMFRSHFRLHLDNQRLDSAIIDLLNKDLELAKKLFRTNRRDLLLFLSHKEVHNIPKNLNNIIYIINALTIEDQRLIDATPDIIKTKIEKYRS